MKSSVRCLQLYGKVVLVSHRTNEFAPIGQHDVNEAAPGIEFSVWIEDFGSQLVPVQISPIASEIRREKAALAGERVALRTLCLSKKECPASFRVSRQR